MSMYTCLFTPPAPALACFLASEVPRRSAHDGAQCVEVHVGARSYGAPRRTLLWCLLDSVRRGAAEQRDSVRRGAEQMSGAAARVPRTSASAARVPRTSAGRQRLCTLFVSRSLPAATRRGLRVYERRRPCKEAAADRPRRHAIARPRAADQPRKPRRTVQAGILGPALPA